MTNPITLTIDQNKAFIKMQEFIDDVENPALCIVGSAGTGKTKLAKVIIDYLVDNNHGNIALVAPTHKARRVLEQMVNEERLIRIPSFTVASVLGKMREHTYIGSHRYKTGSKQKMDRFNFIIVDEISMVGDKDMDEIIDYVCEMDKKLILIGDNCQIPSPSQHLIKKNEYCFRPESLAFDIENTVKLTEIVRQAQGSIIIKLATFLRNNIEKDLSYKDIIKESEIDKQKLLITRKDVYKEFALDWKNTISTRIIAYTNAAVVAHNQNIRTTLGFSKKLVLNELLTGYNNVGWPVLKIENGTDYSVKSINFTTKHSILDYDGLVGTVVDLIDIVDTTNLSRNLFFIDINHSYNSVFMKRLVKLAEKVNKRYSTKNAYKSYCKLKNKAVFLENVYKYNNKIMTKTELKLTNPLLFTKVGDVIDVKSKAVVMSELTNKLEEMYGCIIEGRLVDNKAFADSEVFADQFMVVEKDIDYGYSITIHKSEGSTYNNVYIDELDFKKIRSRWNYRIRMLENRVRERNQLRYVAYTRASTKLKLII